MKFKRAYTLKEIASIIKCEYVGDPLFKVSGMNEIHIVSEGDIVFVDHPKYYDKALESEASIILINKEVNCPPGKALLISEDPFRDFNKLTNHFNPFIAATAVISSSSEIGKNTIIQPNVFVGNNVIIANNVPLGGHAIIEDNVVIGGNSAVQQFTRIGKMAMIGGMTGVLHDVIPYGLSTGNRNSLQGLNLIGLRRAKYENKDILGLSDAYKEIFATKNINENISKLNGSFQENPLVKDVIKFITKDKKRSICTPFS